MVGDKKMMANIETCTLCPFSIYINDIKGNFLFMCTFKKVWYKIPPMIFMNVWLEKRKVEQCHE